MTKKQIPLLFKNYINDLILNNKNTIINQIEIEKLIKKYTNNFIKYCEKLNKEIDKKNMCVNIEYIFNIFKKEFEKEFKKIVFLNNFFDTIKDNKKIKIDFLENGQ
jgi:hypothetical protein